MSSSLRRHACPYGSFRTQHRGSFRGARPFPLLIATYNAAPSVRAQYQDPCKEYLPADALVESVERLVVKPVFRAVPWDVERLRQQELKPAVSLLLISESDVCRSVLAAACLQQQLQAAGLADQVEISTCGTRPYNLGDGPEEAALKAASARGWALPDDHEARLFNPASDIVSYDMLLVVDKFTASDVMREVSSFDLINRDQSFSYKVRRLGEFRTAAPSKGFDNGNADELDIDDPLYGNVGGETEERAVQQACDAIEEACRGLTAFLQAAAQPASLPASEPRHTTLGPAVRARVQRLAPTPWLAPPMLSARVDTEELGGW